MHDRLVFDRWSPQQIAAGLRSMHPDQASQRISHETIYAAIYAHPRGGLKQALLNACSASPVGSGVLFHSSRGSQYASDAFATTLATHGFEPSMSRKGNCWNNAVAESFSATLKNEEATRVYGTKAAAHAAIASYIHGFYNPTRLHSALGYLSPNDYAKRLRTAA